MTTQKAQYSPAYDEQIQEIDRELKAQDRRWPTFAAVSLLLGGIALLLLLGKNFDFPDSRTRAGLGVLLIVLFVLWEISVRRTGLPRGLSTERIAESAQELDFLADWFGAFIKVRDNEI